VVTRIVRLPGGEAEELRDRLADALANEDDAALAELLGAARRQLQDAIEGELHRLVGEIVLEVSAQPHLRDKVGRAIMLGSSFLESLPPPRVLRQLAQPEQFTARCRAACSGLLTYLGGELNRGLDADGRPGLPPAMARLWVEECVDHLRLAMQRSDVDGIDRRSELAAWFTAQFDAEELPAPGDQPPTWLL
jgi:hypothetical protein